MKWTQAEWTGRTALITGGVPGIGFGIARAFSGAGIDLILTYRNEGYRICRRFHGNLSGIDCGAAAGIGAARPFTHREPAPRRESCRRRQAHQPWRSDMTKIEALRAELAT